MIYIKKYSPIFFIRKGPILENILVAFQLFKNVSAHRVIIDVTYIISLKN